MTTMLSDDHFPILRQLTDLLHRRQIVGGQNCRRHPISAEQARDFREISFRARSRAKPGFGH